MIKALPSTTHLQKGFQSGPSFVRFSIPHLGIADIDWTIPIRRQVLASVRERKRPPAYFSQRYRPEPAGKTEKIFEPFLPPSRKAVGWGWRSAGRLLNLTVDISGQLATRIRAQLFHFILPIASDAKTIPTIAA